MFAVLKTEAFFSDEEFDDIDDKATYKSMLTRDERRFKSADRDGDGIATREEFTAFLHPEEFDNMRDVVVQVEWALWNVKRIFKHVSHAAVQHLSISVIIKVEKSKE